MFVFFSSFAFTKTGVRDACDIFVILFLEDMALKSSRFRRELMQKEALEQEESRSRASKIFFSKLSYFLTCLRFYEKVYNVIMTTSLSHHASLL